MSRLRTPSSGVKNLAGAAFHAGCILWLVAAACKQASKDARPADIIAPVLPGPSQACAIEERPMRLRASNRVVAMGDVHGDLSAARAALRAARIVGDDDKWIGGDAVVVQTGDLLDRGDDEQALIDWFEALETQAQAAGGAFVWLLGNHEIMNAAGDFRYVTPGGFADFADVPHAPGPSAAQSRLGVPPEAVARADAFAPGGTYARVLAKQQVIAVVNDTVFSHAGITAGWAASPGAINHDTQCWLHTAAALGATTPPTAVTSPDGPVWTRAYGGEEVNCQALSATLKELGVARMVVGHSVQADGISSRCDGALWRIDVGMAAHYGGNPAVLELVAGQAPRVIVAEANP